MAESMGHIAISRCDGRWPATAKRSNESDLAMEIMEVQRDEVHDHRELRNCSITAKVDFP